METVSNMALDVEKAQNTTLTDSNMSSTITLNDVDLDLTKEPAYERNNNHNNDKDTDKDHDHDKSGHISESEGEGETTTIKLPLRERLHHFTFAWYTLTMSMGGISLLLILLPYRFPGLYHIGAAIFILDLILQLLITILLAMRFILYPGALIPALTRPPESFFLGTPFLSLAATLSNAAKYGVPSTGPWLPLALRITFWIYLLSTFLLSVYQYHVLFASTQVLRLEPATDMTPAWILPIFPVMLAGTLAGFFAPSQPEGHALAIISAGAAAQGLGMLISLIFYAILLSRLLGNGFPDMKPGIFMTVGPPSFTAAALVSLGKDVPRILSLSSTTAVTAGAAETAAVPLVKSLSLTEPLLVGEAFRLVCVGAAMFMWGLSFWFFLLSLSGTVFSSLRPGGGMRGQRFRLGWWSFVFPNVGFAIATLRIGDAVGSGGVMWMGEVMAGVLVVVWVVLMGMSGRAVINRVVCWPGMDEDAPHC